jgi:hypothetical protein
MLPELTRRIQEELKAQEAEAHRQGSGQEAKGKRGEAAPPA